MEEHYKARAELYNQKIIPGTPTTYSSTYTNTHTNLSQFPTYRFHFQRVSDLFDLNLTFDQISMLDELFNSMDDSNRIVAREMFKTILIRKLKEELKEII